MVVNVTGKTLREAISIAKKYLMLPRDAIHITTCRELGIKHIASNDVDFERVDFYEPLETLRRKKE